MGKEQFLGAAKKGFHRLVSFLKVKLEAIVNAEPIQIVEVEILTLKPERSSNGLNQINFIKNVRPPFCLSL